MRARRNNKGQREEEITREVPTEIHSSRDQKDSVVAIIEKPEGQHKERNKGQKGQNKGHNKGHNNEHNKRKEQNNGHTEEHIFLVKINMNVVEVKSIYCI